MAANQVHSAPRRLAVNHHDVKRQRRSPPAKAAPVSAQTDDVTAASPVATGSKRSSPLAVDTSDTSDAAVASTTESDHKSRRAAQAKKSTYVVRKEETQTLLREMEVLQERLRSLDEQRSCAAGALAASQRDNELLRESVRAQQLALAASQCVVSGLLCGEHSNPLSINHIRLDTDWDYRRETLLAMKDRTIRHACEYITARSRFLDPLKRHVCEERFENPNGDFCFAEYDVHQFPNVKSVRQVYDALVSYFLNVEISVSEQLGDITTRDDFDCVEDSITSFRLLTTEFGVPMEKHGVLFMEFFESHELFDGEPCGVVVIDRVEEDELYPYTPRERMRKDISAAVVLRPHWRESHDSRGGSEKELVVSMSIAKFKKLYHSQCPLATPEAVEKMRESVLGWGSVMISTMREALYRNPQ